MPTEITNEITGVAVLGEATEMLETTAQKYNIQVGWQCGALHLFDVAAGAMTWAGSHVAD